jgi:hypothetical protein
MTVKTHAVKPRYKGFRPFFGFTEDDGSVISGVGFVTYKQNDDGEETYQISKIDLGVRSDHIVDAVNNMQGNEVAERLVSNASERDSAIVGTVKQNAKCREDDANAEANQRKSDEGPNLAVA